MIMLKLRMNSEMGPQKFGGGNQKTSIPIMQLKNVVFMYFIQSVNMSWILINAAKIGAYQF